MYFFKTSPLPTPCNLFWASLRLILSYVSVALGRLRAGSPSPPHATPLQSRWQSPAAPSAVADTRV